MEQNEESFLRALAERPFDRTLRLVFSDWLLESRDNHAVARGEAISLFEKGTLSALERRKLTKLQETHGRAWLGPLGARVEREQCRFEGGLLKTVCFPSNMPAADYAALVGEPRLALVDTLRILPGRVAAEVGQFLSHPVLGRVIELEGDLDTLLKADGYGFVPQMLKLHLWQPRADLARFAAFSPLKLATVLQLRTVEFILPELVDEVVQALWSTGALEGRTRLELFARHATFEGVVAWLRAGGPMRGKLVRWSVDFKDVQLGLEGDDFELLTVDTLAHDARDSIAERIAVAASVISLLDGIGLRRVEVRHVPGGKLDKDELNTMRAGLRRLKGLEEFRVAGVPLSP